MTVTKSCDITFENAVREAAEGLKSTSTITPENGVTSTPPRRHDTVATAVILKKLEGLEEENRSLKEEIRKRDSLFVEILEGMKHKLHRIEEQQQLVAPISEELEIDASEQSSQEEESTPEMVTEKKTREVYGQGSETNKRRECSAWDGIGIRPASIFPIPLKILKLF